MRGKADFVGIDVADSCDNALVEQQLLQRPSASAEFLLYVAGRYAGRFPAEPFFSAERVGRSVFYEPEPAEPARVLVAQLASVSEREHNVRVLFIRRGERIDCQATGHAQVQHNAVATFKVNREELSTAREVGDNLPPDAPGEFVRVGTGNN